MELKFQVATKIQKPLAEVFDAVYNPKKLSGYFTNGGAEAPLDEGKTVQWAFEDEPGNKISFPVKVKKMVPNKMIQFTWAASEGSYDPATHEYPKAAGYDTLVEILFEPLGKSETVVKIRESGWRPTQGGLEGSYNNCSGWMHMGLCLKAYLEHGIDLRKGSF
jgi:uncharacterized protein YndB with AHSA1/START domain